MSGQPTVNIVDDDEMSLQGSVNAPMVVPSTAARVQAPTRQQYETPSGLPPWPHSPWPKQCKRLPLPCSRVYLQDAVELHPLFLLQGKCATQCCCPHGPRGRAVLPGDQGSLPRSVVSFPGYVCKTWTNPGKSAGTGEHGGGIKIGPARGSGIFSTGTRDTT